MIPQAQDTPLVLASASPRRRALLAAIGARFEAVPVSIDETPGQGEAPEPYVRRVAGNKAQAARALRPDRWILAADTVVDVDGTILTKPADAETARGMLLLLSGRMHRVLTAVWLMAPDGTPHVDDTVVSHVHFRPLASHEIDAYIATGEPFDKAGAYAVQGFGGRFVQRVEGSFTCVVGLPMELVTEALSSRGILG